MIPQWCMRHMSTSSQSFFVLCTLYLYSPICMKLPILLTVSLVPATSVMLLSIVYCYGFFLTCFFWSSDQYQNLPGPLPWRWCVSAVQLSLASQIRDLDGNLILKQVWIWFITTHRAHSCCPLPCGEKLLQQCELY